MKNNGLLSWMKSTFGGAEKILTGKRFPLNFGAFHSAMLELL